MSGHRPWPDRRQETPVYAHTDYPAALTFYQVTRDSAHYQHCEVTLYGVQDTPNCTRRVIYRRAPKHRKERHRV